MNIKAEIKDLQQRLTKLEQQLLDDEPSYDWDNAIVITTIDGFEYRLGPHAEKEMTWYDAVKWCESVGGELPPREVLLMCYLNSDRKLMFTIDYYWSSTEVSDTNAWVHYFPNGFQNDTKKIIQYNVRAVKRFPIDN